MNTPAHYSIFIVPASASVIEAAREASRRRMHLITNGRATAISPFVPAGYVRLSVSIKREEVAADGAAFLA